MRKFLYRFLVVALAFGLFVPTWLATGGSSTTKAEAAAPTLTSGPNTGSAFSNDNSTGTRAWADTDDVATADGEYATFTSPSLNSRPEVSNYLKVTDFKLNIPDGVKINGIEVSVLRKTDSSSVKDVGVYLIRNGVIIGSNLADTANFWVQNTQVTKTYGGPTDLWGVSSWSSADLNDALSGFAFSAARTAGTGDRTVYVDNIEMKVYYTDITKPVINNPATSAPDTTGEVSLITIDASDNVGITSASININGAVNPLSSMGSNIYSYQVYLPKNHLDVINYTVIFDDAAHNGPTTASYQIVPADNDAPTAPVASVVAGNYTSVQTVTLSSTDNITASPAIYYTLNGTEPSDSNGYVYTGAISIGQTETLKAVAYDEAGYKSAVASFAYQITIASDTDNTTSQTSAVTTTSSTTTAVVAGPAVSEQVASDDNGSTITDNSTPDTSDSEQGQIKGEDTSDNNTEEDINWTPWIILFILILLAGAATGGYFYWFGKDEEEEIVSKTVIKNTKKDEVKAAPKKKPAAKKKNSKRW